MAEIYESSILASPAIRVWQAIRDFNALPQWHQAIAESRIEGNAPADQIGCVRAFTLNDGGFLREKLLALSDYDLSFSYSVLESPMPMENYVATLSLVPVTDGDRCFIEWKASFDCAPEHADELIESIGRGVFQLGFTSLKSRFG